MTPEERLKLGEPLMQLVGFCQAAVACTPENALWGAHPVRLANEVCSIWEDMHKTDSNVASSEDE